KVVNEFPGRNTAQLLVEAQAENALNPFSKQGLNLVAEGLDAGDTLLEVLAWQWFKNDGQGRQIQLAGLLHHLLHDRLMPQVHPVKGTDGNHVAAMLGTQISAAANELGARC